MTPLCSGLHPQSRPNFSQEGVPIVGNGRCRGKAGGRKRGFNPSWPPAPSCLRKLWGTSAQKRAGQPSRGSSHVAHSVCPLRTAAFFSAVILWSGSVCFVPGTPPLSENKKTLIGCVEKSSVQPRAFQRSCLCVAYRYYTKRTALNHILRRPYLFPERPISLLEQFSICAGVIP